MEFINKSGNTIYLSDIDLSVTFYENEKIQFIDSDLVKKSKNFQFAVTQGLLFIVETTGEQIEKSLVKNQGEYVKKNVEPQKGDTEPINNNLAVKIRGHFYEAGGYAKVNRNLALGLHKKGVGVYIDPMNMNNIDLNEEEIKELSVLKRNAPNDTIVIDSIIPTYGQESFGKYRILYTTIEAETVPQQFVDSANLYHEVWVTSDFCKKVLEKYNIRPPIYVVPDSVDCDLYKEDVIGYSFNPPLNKFVFVSVFGWSYRKGYDVLLESYLKEFSGNDDVSLLIVSRFQYDSKYKNKIKDTISEYISEYGGNNPAHISRCSKAVPEDQMPELYKACNAFVLFTRGEGFLLTACESSLCGLPVIATRCSAQTMFLKNDNSYLLDVDEVIPMQPGLMHVHYWDGQDFPSLKSEDTIKNAGKLMRQVYENYEEAKDKNKKLSNFIKDNYNIDTICNCVIDRLENIRKKLC